jgi:hypothetical protein
MRERVEEMAVAMTLEQGKRGSQFFAARHY